MKEIVIIHGDKWRLEDIREDVKWCAKQPWTMKKYAKEKDHAHCSICWWTIAISDNPEIGEAYWAKGEHWLCKECHDRIMKQGHNQASQAIGAPAPLPGR